MTVRDAFLAACAGNDHAAAADALRAFLSETTGTAATQFAAKRVGEMAERLALPEMRVALLSSFTIDPLAPHLTVSEFLAGRRLFLEPIPYQQWFTALSAPGSLDEFKPDAVFLLLHLEDVAPLLARRHLAAADALAAEGDQVIGAITESVKAFRARSATPIILCTFVAADRGVERYFDRRVTPSRQGMIDQLNARLSDIARDLPNVFIFDYAETVCDFGRTRWFDPVKSHHTKTALSARALPYLSGDVTGFISALTKPRQKVLAVDLDNTLWGGVVGEDGVDGIAIAGDYPGNAYADFQAFVKNLKASGVALATVSKNNRADAEEVFRAHPDMPLDWDDFATHQIDWNDKAGNVRAIAEEINVGVDALTYVDDNPMECDLVRTYEPDVAVVHLDASPSLFAQKVLATGGFYVANLTDEDRLRAESYAAERERTALAKSTDTQGFLKTLDLRLTLRPPRSGEVDRVAQLFAKTNQFNLTTKRYTASDVMEMCEDPDRQIKIARLADRYGDYGLIGIIVTTDRDEKTREVDSLLMSCRVLGRNVERAIVADLESDARDAGRAQLIGRYCASRKNGMVANFYEDHGFAPSEGEGVFARDLTRLPPLGFPDHVTIIREADAT